MKKPLFTWEFSAPVTVAIALLGIAAVAAMFYFATYQDTIDAGQCRLRYQRAHSAADSSAVDAQRVTQVKAPQLTCGALRRLGQVR